MAGKGGKRLGAGRKPGTKNTRTASLAAAAAAKGVTPVDVMLEAMRYHHQKAQTAADEITLDPETGQVIAAPKAYHYSAMLEFARYTAPYVHPRLANVEVTGAGGGPIEHVVSHDERVAQAAGLLTEARKRMSVAGKNGGAD